MNDEVIELNSLPKETSAEDKKQFAKDEFNRFMEIWDIDTDREFMDADTVKSFDEIERQITREILRDRFFVEDDCARFVLNSPKVQGVKEVTIEAPNFGALVKTDQFKEGQNIKKLNEMIAALTKLNPAVISKLSMADGMFLQACANLFFSR